jgi:hypothetical protein
VEVESEDLRRVEGDRSFPFPSLKVVPFHTEAFRLNDHASSARASLEFIGVATVEFKQAWRNGTTHVMFTPQEFIEKLIPLIPRPRSHVVRHHGILGPAAEDREKVVLKPGLVEYGRGTAAPGQRHTRSTRAACPCLACVLAEIALVFPRVCGGARLM